MKSITVILLLFVYTSSFSQLQEPAKSSYLQTDYLKKSKKQETAAWVLLGSGVALFSTGLIVYPKDWDWLFGTTPEKEDEATLSGILLFVGSAGILSSIPLFIASGKNRKRAANLKASLIMETIPTIQKSTFVQNSYPAFSIKLKI